MTNAADGAAGGTADAFAAAAAALAARDADLAAADRAVHAVLTQAGELAAESVRRLDNVRDQIEAVAGEHAADPVRAHELTRFLVDKNREIIAVLDEARAAAAAKAAALQELTDLYSR